MTDIWLHRVDRPAPWGFASSSLPVTYDADLAFLLRLWARITALNILTLGFYRFWGKTRIRQYLWSRIAIDGDRLEYDGTGSEKCARFCVAFILIAPLLALPLFVLFQTASAGMFRLSSLFMALIFYILGKVAYYGSRRYRLSRTVWRGIRGDLNGSAWVYAAMVFGKNILVILTFGIYSPWKKISLWAYECKNTRVGDWGAEFRGRGSDLTKAFFWGILLFFIIFAVVAGVFLGLCFSFLSPFVSDGDMEKDVFLVFFFALALLSFFIAKGLAFSWYDAVWLNTQATFSALGPLRFEGRATAMSMFRLRLGNWGLRLLTLGFGGAFIQHRSLRYLCTHMGVTGKETLDRLSQTRGHRRARSEGLADLLDIGEGLG